LGHKLIDNGVDVILGHHSHVFQKIEVYRNKIIAYSLGNFIFDMKEDENVRSGILEISIDHNKNLKANIIPTIQKNYKISIDLTRVGGMDRMLTSNIYYSNDAQKRNHFSLRKKHNLDILFFYLLHLHKFSLVFHLKTISRWSKKVLARL
jgi:poly-gamma-glutamate synthesis protein (capsule biosynthesis protein)